MVIEALDVLYVPSRDVEADVAFYRDVLGAHAPLHARFAGGPRLGAGRSRVAAAQRLAGDADAFAALVDRHSPAMVLVASASRGSSASQRLGRVHRK